MSWVANLLVSVASDDVDTVAAFNEWLRDRAPRSWPEGEPGPGYLNEITGKDTRWGGWKNPECDVWAGTVDKADLDAVVRKFGETAWRQPNAVQLFVMDQQEVFFRLWMIREGKLQQYAPERPDEGEPDFWVDE
jgi:hypothetical protein